LYNGGEIMPVDGFNELFNVVYIAKKLHEMGKYELVKSSFFEYLDLDAYFENMYSLIPNLFEYCDCYYYEYRGIDLHVVSDPVIVDFYILAGKYGKQNNIPDENNPYIKAAQKQTRDYLNISHELDWMLMGHTEPMRPFHSRLGLFISYECGCLDPGVLAYRLIELYKWFSDKCAELSNILLEDAAGQLMLNLGVLAA